MQQTYHEVLVLQRTELENKELKIIINSRKIKKIRNKFFVNIFSNKIFA